MLTWLVRERAGHFFDPGFRRTAMNIAQVKQIPLQYLAEQFGGRLSHRKATDAWYYSPFRPEERTASFKVNEKMNTWYDFAEGKGGSILDLWIDYYNMSRTDGTAVREALKALHGFADSSFDQGQHQPYQRNDRKYPQTKNPAKEEPRYKIIKPPSNIWHDNLKAEIGRRGLSMATVQPYLKQVAFMDTETKKTYTGFAFENDQDGLEISIPNPKTYQSFKTCIRPKTITSFVPENCETISVFEGFWDFLTWKHIRGDKEKQGYIVLNSVSNARKAVDFLVERKNTIKFVFLFMDNDRAGEKALHDMALELEPHGFRIGSMNHFYERYKDLNEYWMKAEHQDKFLNKNNEKVLYDTAWNLVKKSIGPARIIF